MRRHPGVTALHKAIGTKNYYTSRLIFDTLEERYKDDPRTLLRALTAPNAKGETPEMLAKKTGNLTGLAAHIEVSVKRIKKQLGMETDDKGPSR